MAPSTPYTADLGDREPLAVIRANGDRVRALTRGWTSEQFERSYARGKWTARQLVTHLAHTEMVLGTRVRMALSTPSYVVQPFDQDLWIARERLSGADAVDAFVAVSRMNLSLFEGLSAADRQTGMSHPEYGTITVDWIVYLLAGHQIHHLRQLEAVPH